MNHPTELILENFRCFRTEQRGRLRPITLLVGENSTGKSSFLASYIALAQCIKGQYMSAPDFNIDPFELGSFNDILHSSAGNKSSSEKFTLGLNLSNGRSDTTRLGDLHVAFGQKSGLPQVHNLRREFPEKGFIELRRLTSGTRILTPEFSTTLKLPLYEMCRIVERIATDVMRKQLKERRGTPSYSRGLIELENSDKWRDMVENVEKFLTPIVNGRTSSRIRIPIFDPFEFRSLRQITDEIVPIAPIRSKPKRTYNPLRGQPNPEGEHIPLLLRQLSRSDQHDWEVIHRGLVEFGKHSELFSGIRIRNYAEESNSPFQVQVKVSSGDFVNIMDVGYGVSQSLPVVANILADGVNFPGGGSTFLLQQPEVHLHPRAQAALANVFCDAVKNGRNRFLIETHSDFIVNRVRVLIRRKVIPDSDVSIIYFEREGSGNSAKLFNLRVDQDGNVLDAPNSYRDFFVTETDTVLGFRK